MRGSAAGQGRGLRDAERAAVTALRRLALGYAACERRSSAVIAADSVPAEPK